MIHDLGYWRAFREAQNSKNFVFFDGKSWHVEGKKISSKKASFFESLTLLFYKYTSPLFFYSTLKRLAYLQAHPTDPNHKIEGHSIARPSNNLHKLANQVSELMTGDIFYDAEEGDLDLGDAPAPVPSLESTAQPVVVIAPITVDPLSQLEPFIVDLVINENLDPIRRTLLIKDPNFNKVVSEGKEPAIIIAIEQRATLLRSLDDRAIQTFIELQKMIQNDLLTLPLLPLFKYHPRLSILDQIVTFEFDEEPEIKGVANTFNVFLKFPKNFTFEVQKDKLLFKELLPITISKFWIPYTVNLTSFEKSDALNMLCIGFEISSAVSNLITAVNYVKPIPEVLLPEIQEKNRAPVTSKSIERFLDLFLQQKV